LRQKDRDARWTVKFTKAKPREDGSTPSVDLAIPVFGYQNHVSIDPQMDGDRAAAYEGRQLREGLLDKTNTASAVWADTAYRSAANEAFMEKNGFVGEVVGQLTSTCYDLGVISEPKRIASIAIRDWASVSP
jgi:IS5 family transposase